jgi:hypothetical protein
MAQIAKMEEEKYGVTDPYSCIKTSIMSLIEEVVREDLAERDELNEDTSLIVDVPPTSMDLIKYIITERVSNMIRSASLICQSGHRKRITDEYLMALNRISGLTDGAVMPLPMSNQIVDLTDATSIAKQVETYVRENKPTTKKETVRKTSTAKSRTPVATKRKKKPTAPPPPQKNATKKKATPNTNTAKKKQQRNKDAVHKKEQNKVDEVKRKKDADKDNIMRKAVGEYVKNVKKMIAEKETQKKESKNAERKKKAFEEEESKKEERKKKREEEQMRKLSEESKNAERKKKAIDEAERKKREEEEEHDTAEFVAALSENSPSTKKKRARVENEATEAEGESPTKKTRIEESILPDSDHGTDNPSLEPIASSIPVFLPVSGKTNSGGSKGEDANPVSDDPNDILKTLLGDIDIGSGDIAGYHF